jgi:hypothetical protein
MPTYELTSNDGRKYRIDAESPELAQKAFDHQFAPKQPQPEDPGTTAGDVGRMLMTAGVRGAGLLADGLSDPLSFARKLISPELEAIEQSATRPGQAIGDAVFSATGVPEYQPTTPTGRTAMAAGQGLVAGAPFGLLGAGIGAASGLFGQGTQEATGSERLSTVAGLVPGGAVAAARLRPQRAEIPTAQELVDTGGAGFDRARAMGVEIDPNPVASLAQRIHADLTRNAGMRQSFAPDTFDILSEMASPPNVPGGRALYEFADLHAIRRQLQEVINNNQTGLNAKKSDAKAAGIALRELDNFIENLGANPQHLVAGTPQAATELADTFRSARGNYAAGQKSNDITGELDKARTGIEERADGRASATHSGRNLDNNLRQRVESYIENQRNVLGLSENEIAALKRVVDRDFSVREGARFTSNWLGGGGGMQSFNSGLAGTAGGAMIGGPATALLFGAGLPFTGLLARTVQNSLGRRRLHQADDTIRKNSPLYESRLSQLPARDVAILRALLPGIIAQQEQE